MIDQIKQIPNHQSLSPQQIQDYLNESVEVVDMRGWTPVTMQSEEGGLSFQEVNILLETLRLGGGLASSAFTWLSTNTEGLEFGSDGRQAMVDQLSIGGQWESQSPGMTAKVKALGRNTKKRFEQLGLQSLPTVEQIEDALNPDFDSESYEVLFTLNRQANGQTFCVMRTTPVKLRDGVVVFRGESSNVFDNPVISQIKQLIEGNL